MEALQKVQAQFAKIGQKVKLRLNTKYWWTVEKKEKGFTVLRHPRNNSTYRVSDGRILFQEVFANL